MGSGRLGKFLWAVVRKILESGPVRYKSRPGVRKIEDIELWHAFRKSKRDDKKTE